MPVYVWKEAFIDERECRVEASSLEEAKEKQQGGDWLSEQTINLYSHEILSEISLEDESK